jgi:ribosomal protein S6--L-glutamate ligase
MAIENIVEKYLGDAVIPIWQTIENLREAKDTTKMSLILLSNKREESDETLFRTVKRFSEECKKAGIPHYILFVENSHIRKQDDGTLSIHNVDDDKGFQINPELTAAIIRGSTGRLDSTKDMISQLEKAGVFCINDRECLETCSDKYRTILKMGDAGIPAPKTALIQSMDTVPYALEQLDNKFPMVVKTLHGSKGIGSIIVETERSLKSMLQLIWKIEEDTELLIQKFIKSDFDLRIHVLNGEVIAAMKRFVIEDDFRSNYSQGGKVTKVKLTDDQTDIAIKAAKAVGAIWSGVDIISDKSGDHVIEVNSSPGTAGIEKATGQNVVKTVLDFIISGKNWFYTPIECGFIEMVNVLGFDMRAKFDTGNGNMPVIHSDEYSIKNKKVTWKLNDKKFTNPLVRIESVNVGGLRNYKEDRPVILLDVHFFGTVYMDVEFTIDDRTNRTPILFDRSFMKKARVTVNPAKRFWVTDKSEEM